MLFLINGRVTSCVRWSYASTVLHGERNTIDPFGRYLSSFHVFRYHLSRLAKVKQSVVPAEKLGERAINCLERRTQT